MKVKGKSVKPLKNEKGGPLRRRLPFSAKPSYFPLKGKKVYLDLKNYRPVKTLEEDLIGLGATIEKFLSREINYLISSQEKATRTNKGENSVDGQDGSTPSPGLSNLSPFNMGQDVSPSLLHDTQKKLQTSRGKAMLKKARVDVAKSVLDNAEKWGVKIIHIDGALKWVQKEKEKALSVKGEQPNTQKVPQKKDKPKKEKLLKSPVVKFESTTRGYRPLYLELDSWPHVNVDTALGTCPFDTVCRGARSGCKRAALQAERLGAFEPLQPPLSSQGEDREQDTPRANTAKKDISGKTDSVGFAQIVTAGQLKRLTEKKRRAEKKRGYCECCKMKYEDLFKHLRGEEHRQYVGQEADHYRDLDSLIAKGPCAEDFVNSVKMEQSGPGSVDSPVLSPVRSEATEEYILLLSPFRGKFNNQPTEKVPASPKNRCKKNPQKLIATERRHEHHLQDTEDWKQIRKEPNTVKTKTKNQRRKQTRREIKSPKQTKKECEQNVEILLPDSKSSKKETPGDEDKQHVEPDFRKLNVSKQKCDPVDIVKMKRISTDTKGDQTVSSERKNITNQNISVNLKEECVRAEENNSDVQKMKLEETRSLEKRIKPCSVACEVLVLSPTKQYCLRSGKIDPTPLSAKTNSNNEGPGIKTCLKNESDMVLPAVQTNANLLTKEESKNTAPVDFVGINSRSALDDEKLILAKEDCGYSSVDRYKGSNVQSESVTSVEKDVKGQRRRTRLSLSKTQKQTSPQQSEPNSLKQGSVHSVDTAGIISKAQTSNVSLKNEGQDVAGSIIPASQASTSSVAKPKKKARMAAAKTIRNCKRLGFYKSKWRTFRSVRHFKLPEKWRMLTNRSVKKLFSSDEDSQTFEGFTEADLAHNGAIRSDMSFEEKSDICLEEGSEIEWEITMKSQETLMNESVPSELQTNTNIVQNEASAFQLSFSKTPRNADRYNKSFEFSPPIDKSGSVATETLEILKNTPNKTGNNDFQFSSPISPACVWQWKNKGHAAKRGRKTPLVKPLQAKGENVSWTRSVTKNDFVDNLRNQDSDTSFIFSDPIHEPLISPLNTPSKAVLNSGNRSELNPDVDDDEVVFNFSSPQKLKTVFSPLKSSDCCLLSSPITNNKDYDRTILAYKQVRKSSSSKRLNLGYSNTDAIFSTPVKSRNANNEMDLTGNLQQRNLRCSTPNKTIRSLKIVDNLPMSSQFSSPLKCQEALSSGLTAAPSVVQMGQKSFTKNEQSPMRNMYLGYAKTPTKNTPTKQFECVRGRGADKNKTATPTKKLSSNDSDEIRKVNASENRTETENKTSSISIVCEIQLRRSPRKKSTDLCSVKVPKAGSRKSISSCLAKPKSQPLEIRLSAEKEKDKTDDPCRSLPPRKLLKKSLNETDKKVPHVYRFDYITTSKGNPAKFGHMQHSKSRKCTVSSSKRSYCPSEIVKAANKRQKQTDKENDNFTGTPENDMVDFDKSSVEKWKAKNCNVLTKTEDYQRRPKSEILHYSKTFLKKQVLLNSCKNNESEVTVDSNNKSGRTSKMVIAMKKEFNQAKKLRTSPRKAGVTQYDFESSG